jgi:predicted nucleotidyltransferase
MDAEALRARLEPIFRRHGHVVVAYLFGSAARGDTHERSDLDLAVLFDGRDLAGYRALWIDLRDALGARDFDLVALNGAGPVLGFEILRDGRPLYARSVEELNEFERRAWHRYQDTRRLRAIGDDYLKGRAHAWSSERNRSASDSSGSKRSSPA